MLDTQDIPENLVTINKEMLDDSNAAKEQMENVKSRLQAILNPFEPLKLSEQYLPEYIKDPETFLQEIIDLLATLRSILKKNLENPVLTGHDKWCCNESSFLFWVCIFICLFFHRLIDLEIRTMI